MIGASRRRARGRRAGGGARRGPIGVGHVGSRCSSARCCRRPSPPASRWCWTPMR
jgi:hypothetical protein